MNSFAKIYIATVITVGVGMLTAGMLYRNSPDLTRFFVYLLLGLLASTWKVKLPGFTGTISGNFLFVLIGISAFSLAETVVLAAASALAQSFWRVKRNPLPVQVGFNMAVLAISAGTAWLVAEGISKYLTPHSLIVLLVPAACVYFVANTGLVSGVVALVEQKRFTTVWYECHGWSFPYYVMGAGLAALISISGRTAGWNVSLLIVPAMYLVYTYYRFYVQQATAERLRIAVNDQEHEMVVSTR